MQNDAGTCSFDWHKIDTACSADVPGQIENPGALAGATGANGFRLKLVELYGTAEAVAMAFPILSQHWGALA